MMGFGILMTEKKRQFKGTPAGKEFELLAHTFLISDAIDISFYQDLIRDIELIQQGVLSTNVISRIGDFLPEGIIQISSENTIYEIPNEGKRLEISTNIYKQLLKDWVQFVLVNLNAYSWTGPMWFQILMRDWPLKWFKGTGTERSFDILGYTLSVSEKEDLSWCYDLVDEITSIQNGELQTNEEFIIRPYSPTGEVYIHQDKTVYDIPEENWRLEIPTAYYKHLLEDWLKFVEINRAAFTEPQNI